MRIHIHKLDDNNEYDAPLYESMKIKHTKNQENGHLYYRSPIETNPLNLLPSKVEESWPQVYSDICHKYDRRTFAGTTIRSILKNSVEDKVYTDLKGKLRNSKGELLENSWINYYVDPESSRLKRNEMFNN